MRVVSAVESFGSVGDRLLAILLDRALLGALMLAVAASLQKEGARLDQQLAADRNLAIGAAVTLALVIFVYHTIFEAAFGATLGKAIFGLSVRNESDRNRFMAAVIRNAVRPIDALGFYAVAFFVALFSPRKQRIGDYLAKTIVLEYRIHPAARAIFLVLWAVLVAGSVWLAGMFCPTCVNLRF